MERKMTSITDRIFQSLVLLLLAGILLMQVLAFTRRPVPSAPTLGEMRSASPQRRQELLKNTPLMRVYGPVDVDGPVEGDGTVEVTNEPLSVEITN
jgi:hypothetical protein